MIRKIKDKRYPVLDDSTKKIFQECFSLALGDLKHGLDSMREMAKIEKADWVLANCEYFRHGIGALKYMADRLKLRVKVGK